MDRSRIQGKIDFEKLASKSVAIWGAGGSVGLVEDLARCGLRNWQLVDPDVVEPCNMVRQGHAPENIGRYKVDALRQHILAIDREASVETFPRDCCVLPDAELQRTFAGAELVIAATDAFHAQARASQLALMLNVPFLAVGITAGGRGGEIVWWAPDRDACFRCLCSKRYEAQEQARREGRKLDPSSDGVDIMAVRYVDAIAAQLAIGLLTRGSDNAYGRLINRLGDRQYVLISLDPDHRISGKDVIREKLGIVADCSAYFAWNAIALSDPDRGNLPCPDCERYRNCRFVSATDGSVRRQQHEHPEHEGAEHAHEARG